VTTGALTPLLKSVPGLTALLSPDATKVLYASSANTSLLGFIYERSGAKTSPLPLTTLPEKCAWGVSGASVLYCAVPKSLPRVPYPDAWYQGLVSFDDRLWYFEPESGNSKLLVDPGEEGGQAVDAVNFSVSPDGSYLLFINKKDGSLWGFDLARAGAVAPENDL
jgi:hypothetical protein